MIPRREMTFEKLTLRLGLGYDDIKLQMNIIIV
jgi:hypothetical protein